MTNDLPSRLRVAHVVTTPGAYYCENCVRDNALVVALRRLGHDVFLVPMYLPLPDEFPAADRAAQVHFGAIALYLREKLPFLRRLPRWLDGVLSARPLLAYAARKAGATRAAGLADLTHSILLGESGPHARDVERLVSWLAGRDRPDVVHLSNALFLGLARRLKSALGVAVVCSLHDEDKWVDAMPPAAAARVWRTLAERAAGVDAFVSVSAWYAALMGKRLGIPAGKLHVVRPGIVLEGCARRERPAPPVLGYLSRLAESLGLGTLAEAFVLLKRGGRVPGLRLRLIGGSTGDDRRFLAGLRRRFARAGCLGDLEIVDGHERAARLEFLRTLSVLSVPAAAGAFGTYLLEALAVGVPVVQPALGAFPEVLEATGGGVLYEPNTPEALAEALAGLLTDPERQEALGAAGRQAVFERFSMDRAAEEMLAVYEAVRARSPRDAPRIS